FGYRRVVNIGETVKDLGKVTEIRAYDEINTSGQLTFWAKTKLGETIVRATPPLLGLGGAIIGVTNLALSSSKQVPGSANQGVDRQIAVTSFKPVSPHANPARFKATIAWGDGTTSPGQVITGRKGNYVVLGDHTYHVEGTYMAMVAFNEGPE